MTFINIPTEIPVKLKIRIYLLLSLKYNYVKFIKYLKGI